MSKQGVRATEPEVAKSGSDGPQWEAIAARASDQPQRVPEPPAVLEQAPAPLGFQPGNLIVYFAAERPNDGADDAGWGL